MVELNRISPFLSLLVLDLTRYLPGGYATQVLADLGAEVVKVEDTLHGDYMRLSFPQKGEGVSYYVSALGRNKKSISLDLKDDDVKTCFLDLAKRADVIVESFRPGVTKRLGIDYETVRKDNPTVIYCSISAYGQDDPESLKAAHDINMQARSGYLSLNGGQVSPIHLCDLSSAMVAGQALLGALYIREKTGEGSYIDTSMYDCFVWWNSLIDSRWGFNGGVCAKEDLAFPTIAYNVYETKDGKQLAFGIVEAKFWDAFCDEIGYPEIKAEREKRPWESPYACNLMESVVKSKTMDEWKKWLEGKDLCVEEVLDKTRAIHRLLEERPQTMREVDFPRVGKVIQTCLPHHLSSAPSYIEGYEPVSALGSDTESYLEMIGRSKSDIEEMASRGSVLIA